MTPRWLTIVFNIQEGAVMTGRSLTSAKDGDAEYGPPTVYIVDDDRSVHQALDSLLRSADLMVRSFFSPDEFLKYDIPDDVPSCMLLDVRFPGQSGFHLQSAINGMDCPTPIIFLSGYADTQMAVKAMKAGAVDFLSKPFRDQDMLDAVALAIDSHRLRLRAARGIKQLRARYELLTSREREVLLYVVAGRLNKQIAAELKISECTVKVHRRNAMEKMEATSVVDLVQNAMTIGLPVNSLQFGGIYGHPKQNPAFGSRKAYDCVSD
jgi:FixJ family two-component response regulator